MAQTDPQFMKIPVPGEHPSSGSLVPVGDGEDSKYRRVAKFLILIGADEAARILPHLEPDQIEAVSREIATVRGITPEEGESVMEEFKSLLSASYRYEGASKGGVEAARGILYAAFGPEKGEALLNKSLPASRESPFNFLEDFKPEQIAFLLKDESPAAGALILSRLPPKLSAAVLANTTGEHRMEIVRRIAHQSEIIPEVLERIAETLKEKALAFSDAGTDTVEVNGMKALAEILRHGSSSLGDKILKNLEEQEPDLGKDLKEELLTLDDVAALDDKVLQGKLRTMADRDIALLLKGRDQDFTGKLLSNVSAQRRTLIREEGELMGPVPRRDVDEAARIFLDWLWAQGPEVLQAGKELGTK
jgi:flagellar motor switch protein FliG